MVNKFPERVVIVGGGVAAHRCALELRHRQFPGSISMVCSEHIPPYDRTLLSKDFLTNELQEPDLALASLDDYSNANITLHLDCMAERIDVPSRRIYLSTGECLSYDALVICTGGRPRLPTSLACPGVLLLRDVVDAQILRNNLLSHRRIVVIGGGFIGGEVVSSAMALGLETIMIETLPAPLVHILGQEVGLRIAALHRSRGADLILGTPAEEIQPHGDGFKIRLGNGQTLVADLVVIGAGMEPAVAWLRDTPLTVADGLLINSLCRTEAPGVFGAGDCARWWNPRYDSYMRVEHWETAVEHGIHAARSVLGMREPFAPLPFFWSIQHGVRFQWIGWAPSWDQLDIQDLDRPHAFVAEYRRNGTLKGVFAADQPRAIAAARRILNSGKDS